MPTKLLRLPTDSNPKMLDELLWVIAANIEGSMQQSSGAIPGEDYTILDLYKLAQPFALEIYKKGTEKGCVGIYTGWPKWEAENSLL